jgi:peptide-methionine (S)-S-oxide reductase
VGLLGSCPYDTDASFAWSEKTGLWPGKVVTEIKPAGRFWDAEDEDQYYLQKHPDGETCHFPRPGWKLPHRETASRPGADGTASAL